MKFDFTQKLKSLDGQEGQDTLAQAVQLALNEPGGKMPPIRAWELAQKLSKPCELSLDDLKSIDEEVERSQQILPFAKAQVLIYTTECRDKLARKSAD